MPTAVLVVDHPLRDLRGLALTAAALCRRGITCVLTPLDLQEQEIWRLAPDFVLLNYFRRHHSAFYRRLADSHIAFGSLETEGGVADDWERFDHLIVAEEELRQRLKIQCCWGPLTAERFLTKGWYSPGQVRLTGCPRIDFYADSWRDAALAATREAVADWTLYERNLVLINSAFVMANPGWSTSEEMAQKFAAAHGATLDEAHVRVQRERVGLRELTNLSNRLAAEFPRATFVYRPHPFEGLAAYETLLARLPNLHCVRAGAVDGWILRAKAVIQRGCSTGYEAAMAGVATLSPAWLDMPWRLDQFDAVCRLQQTPDEMASSLRSILKGNEAFPSDSAAAELRQRVGDWYHLIDGAAHQRVAESVVEKLPTENDAPRRAACARMARGELCERESWPKRARRVVKQFRAQLGLSGGARKRLKAWDASVKQFDAESVRTIVAAIATSQRGKEENLDRPLDVLPANEAEIYAFGAGGGRSVVVRPRRLAA